MTDFHKQTEMKAIFGKSECVAVNVYRSIYTNNLSITTATGDTINLIFKTPEELVDFLEAVVSVAARYESEESYVSTYAQLGVKDEHRISLAELKNWKSIAEAVDAIDN